MNYSVTTAPVRRAVELDVLKNHLRLTTDTEDALLGDYLDAAVDEAQKYLGRPLITQTLTATTDQWPGDGVIDLEQPPVQVVNSVKYYDEDGVQQTLAASNYWVDTDEETPRIRLKPDSDWPDLEDGRPNPIAIEFDAGYGDEPTDIPAQIRQGILYLAAHYFSQREPIITGTIVSEFPINAIWCWAPYRFETFAS